MDAPPVHYATTEDSVSIAYAVSGRGTPIVVPGCAFEHVQLAWQYPGLCDWLQALSERFQLIQMDFRGRGMSSRGLTSAFSTLDYQKDLRAVIECLGLGNFVLYVTTRPGGIAAAQYALEYPAQVKAIVMSGIFRVNRVPALFDTIAAQDWQLFLQSLLNLGHSSRSPEDLARMVDLFDQAWHQPDFLISLAATRACPFDELLTQLRTPALVLHPRDYRFFDQEEAIGVAQLAHASFALIDGDDAWGDATQGIRAIESFLAGLPRSSSGLDSSPLTAREHEVAVLVAHGRTNRQIADELVISKQTADRHVSNILGKLGFTSRAQLAAWVVDRGNAFSPER